ncbi:MAG: hypothetical protein ACRDLM_09550 [Gaiellaceae bacterium]
MNLSISPQPDDAERAAILAALEAEEAEQAGRSEWAKAGLPQREAEDEPQA